MSLNLMTVFKTSDLQKFGQTASNVGVSRTLCKKV